MCMSVVSRVLASTMLSEIGAGPGLCWKPGWAWAPRMGLTLLRNKQTNNRSFPSINRVQGPAGAQPMPRVSTKFQMHA